MDFSKAKEKASAFGKKALQKGKDTKDILSLKMEIKTCEDVISKSYSNLGKKYFELFSETGNNEELDKFVTEIKNAQNAIKDLESKIEALKNNDSNDEEKAE